MTWTQQTMYAVAHEFSGTEPQRATVLGVYATKAEAKKAASQSDGIHVVTVDANAIPGDRIEGNGWSFRVVACRSCRVRRTI